MQTSSFIRNIKQLKVYLDIPGAYNPLKIIFKKILNILKTLIIKIL